MSECTHYYNLLYIGATNEVRTQLVSIAQTYTYAMENFKEVIIEVAIYMYYLEPFTRFLTDFIVDSLTISNLFSLTMHC